MSTSINISNDLNNYLKSSGSSINGNGSGGQSSSNGGNFMNGWFSGSNSGSSKPSGGDNKSWFSYQPLRTSPDDDAASVNSGSTANGQSGGGWLRNPFGTKEPEPQGWLPTLVCPVKLFDLYFSNHYHHSRGHNESLDFSSLSLWASLALAW